jgi:hypothetical protein
MIQAVNELMENNQSRPLTFATAGHEDGIFACGHSPVECGNLLITYLAKARAAQRKEASTNHQDNSESLVKK